MSEINFQTLKTYGPSVTPYLFNRAIDTLQAISLEKGLGYQLRRTPGGTSLKINAGTLSFNPPPAFTVSTQAISGDASNISVNITPGTVNQHVPDNMFDSLTCATSGTFYAKIGVTTDGQNVTSCSLSCDDSTPVAQNATASALPSNLDILLAIVKDKKVYQTQAGSISLVGNQEFITDKPEPANPGELTYIPYYTWAMATV